MHFSNAFILQLCVLIIGVSNVPFVYPTSKSDNSQLFLGKYPIPKRTPDPININTNHLPRFNNMSETILTIHGYINTKVKVINTGKLVKVILDQPSTKTSVTGGVLGHDIYMLKKIKYNWTNNTKGSSAITLNGKGFPLEDMGIFYNLKYGTFRNALKKRDGLAKVIFPIEVVSRITILMPSVMGSSSLFDRKLYFYCSKPNPRYDKFGRVLRRIRRARSSAKTILQTPIMFLAGDAVIPKDTVYYAYPGSYLNENTGKRYYCATVIVIMYDPPLCISKKQFEGTFGSLKNAAGRPLTNKASQFPARMPIVQSRGVLNYNTP